MSEFSTNMARVISEAAVAHVDHGGWTESPDGLRCARDGALAVPTSAWLADHEDLDFECYAWIGEDEYGSGEVGLKQGYAPAGLVPLVAVDRFKLDRADFYIQLEAQAAASGKAIRLVRLVAVEEVKVIDPDLGMLQQP